MYAIKSPGRPRRKRLFEHLAGARLQYLIVVSDSSLSIAPLLSRREGVGRQLEAWPFPLHWMPWAFIEWSSTGINMYHPTPQR